MTWLGVDLGDARVGLALSDPELTFAHPYGNVQAYGDSFRALDDVITVVEDEGVEHIVVGLPLLLDGTEGKSAKKARRWCANLVRRMQTLAEEGDFALARVPTVSLQDERLTTVTAHRQLLDANVGSRRHRPVVDQQSAVMILQSALDSALENRK
ncbi:Holliday junction resolvase RuvX [Bifidobacterium leontopitheci]|uniref:Putative pre-16S rRNA nuclease n=1 Tax=Bifidobacterium leontopitheci TaxID=2650774 RepID=A0A6I1GXP3_9BIFI|nr:Holliday junction resolvase RuvX [Bifidobacterium leontopitheci]KAB7791231.1 Holliday junction DNA helicase [Bifidobacterium leontopitheci]